MLRHASESPYLRTLQRLASIYHLAVRDSSVITPEDEPWLGYGIYGMGVYADDHAVGPPAPTQNSCESWTREREERATQQLV